MAMGVGMGAEQRVGQSRDKKVANKATKGGHFHAKNPGTKAVQTNTQKFIRNKKEYEKIPECS